MGYDGTLKFDTSVNTSGFQSGINKISSIAGGALKTTGAIIAGAGTAIAGLGTAAIKVGADFEAGMSKVQAISNASGEEMVKLTEKAKEMGAKTKFSAGESAEAFQYMAMAGWKTTDMLEGIEGIMNLAAASGEDLATTSDIVTDALTAFGMSASDSGRFADILAAASSNANTNVSMMGETFKYVAPVAGALGFSAEDCATAIGLMANSGIKASQAGTSLRSIFTRMAKPTKDVQAAMDQLGISITNSDGSMKSLNTIMRDLRKGFSGLSEEQKAQMAATLGGQEAMSGLLAIVNASEEDFEKLSESIYNSEGAAEQMAETMMDNLPGAIEQAGGALETLGLTFYEKVQEPAKETIQTITEMIDEMNEAFTEDGFEGLVQSFGDNLAELTQMIVDSAPDFIQAGIDLATAFIDGIMDNSDEFASAGAELVSTLVEGVLEFAGDLWSAGIELFRKFLEGIAENASEIGASAAEMVVEIVTAIQENLPLIIQAGRDIVSGFLEGMSEKFPGISALLEGFISGFADTASVIIEPLADALQKLFDVINNADPSTMEAVGKAIGTIVAAIAGLKIASDVVGAVQTLFSILGKFKGGISGIAGTIGKIVEGFALWKGGAGSLAEVISLEFPKLSGIIGGVGKAVSSVGGFFTKLAGVASSVFSTVSGFISSFGSVIAGAGSLIGGAIMAVTNFFDMLKNGFSWLNEILMVIGTALAAVGAVILGAPALVAGVVAAIVAAVGTLIVAIKENWEAIVEFFQSIPERLSSFVETVVQFFSELPGKIIEALSSFGEMFVEWGTTVLETAITVVTGIIDSIVTFFSELPYKIGYAIGFVIGTLVEWATNVINWIITNVPLIIENIVNFFTELPGKIWTWLTNTYNNLVTWGEQMLQKAIEVAKNCVDNISQFFSELPGKVWSWIKETYDKFTSWANDMFSKARETGSRVIEEINAFFSELPGKVWNWLTDTLDKVKQWGSDMVEKGRQAASDLVEAVIDGVSGLPGEMWDIGSAIVEGVWDGICSAASWFATSVRDFFSGIVDGAKSALGINSPSKVFAEEVGEWIPPGIGKGIEAEMPDLTKSTQAEMKDLTRKMKAAVEIETGTIKVKKQANETYKVQQENGQSFDDSKTEVTISGEIHTHVELDGEEVGKSQTPIIDRNMGRIDTHKKRGG